MLVGEEGEEDTSFIDKVQEVSSRSLVFFHVDSNRTRRGDEKRAHGREKGAVHRGLRRRTFVCEVLEPHSSDFLAIADAERAASVFRRSSLAAV